WLPARGGFAREGRRKSVPMESERFFPAGRDPAPGERRGGGVDAGPGKRLSRGSLAGSRGPEGDDASGRRAGPLPATDWEGPPDNPEGRLPGSRPAPEEGQGAHGPARAAAGLRHLSRGRAEGTRP